MNKSFPVFVIIFLILFTLKLAQVGLVANLSWWWITLPLWGGFFLIFLVLLLIALVAHVNEKRRRKQRFRHLFEK